MDKLIEDIENFDANQEKRKQYMKQYYQQNKEKLKEQQKIANFSRQRDLMKQKINNHEYIRKPHMKIKKYNIRIYGDGTTI